MSAETLLLRLSELEDELQVKKEDLYKAAKCGNSLLSTNQLLNDKLESREKEYSEQIEFLEQGKFSLKMKLECQGSSMAVLQHELDSALNQVDQEKATCEKRLAEVHSKKISDLTALNEDLKVEIEKLNAQQAISQVRMRKMDEILQCLRDELSARGRTSNDLVDLEALYTDEKSRCEGLELQLLEGEGLMKVAEMEIAALQQKITTLEEECQDRNKMAKEWYDALKEAKDHTAELSSELELLKSQRMEGADGDHSQTTGNSLFGEVDDRRMNVERKMISLKVKYESLVHTHTTTTLQLKKMKSEMSSLLCHHNSTTADLGQMQRLQRALSQSNSELQTMSAKLHRMECQQDRGVAVQEVMTAFVDFGDKAEFIRFLQQELEEEKKCHRSAIKELDLKRTQLLWETNKLREAETKLHHSQKEQAKLRMEKNKVQIRLQEAMHKLEQVTTTFKQLEAEKKYLEEELNSKGKRNHNRHPKSETASNSTCNKPDQKTLQHGTCTGTEPSLSLPVEPKRYSLKEVNLLEDLEEKFGSVYGKSGLLDHCAAGKKAAGARLSSSNTAIKPSGRENLGELLAAGQDHQVPAQVVSENSNDTVNKCPQQ